MLKLKIIVNQFIGDTKTKSKSLDITISESEVDLLTDKIFDISSYELDESLGSDSTLENSDVTITHIGGGVGTNAGRDIIWSSYWVKDTFENTIDNITNWVLEILSKRQYNYKLVITQYSNNVILPPSSYNNQHKSNYDTVVTTVSIDKQLEMYISSALPINEIQKQYSAEEANFLELPFSEKLKKISFKLISVEITDTETNQKQQLNLLKHKSIETTLEIITKIFKNETTD